MDAFGPLVGGAGTRWWERGARGTETPPHYGRDGGRLLNSQVFSSFKSKTIVFRTIYILIYSLNKRLSAKLRA